jgi:hypothetical protein
LVLMTVPERSFLAVCTALLALAGYWSGAWEGDPGWRDIVIIAVGGVAFSLVLRLFRRRRTTRT